MSVVLDASALLALLLGEPGAGRVRAALTGSSMSAVNLAEVVGHYARVGASANQARQVVSALPIQIVAFDEDQAHRAGMMIAATKAAGLSLGDRACLALAERLGVKAMTADRQWSRVAAAVGVAIDIIR